MQTTFKQLPFFSSDAGQDLFWLMKFNQNVVYSLACYECQQWWHMPPKAGHFAEAPRLPLASCSGSCTPKPMASTELPEVLLGFGHQQKHLVSNEHLQRTFHRGEVFKLLIFSHREGVWYLGGLTRLFTSDHAHTWRDGKEEPFRSGMAASPPLKPPGDAASVPQVQPQGQGQSLSCASSAQESSLSFSAAAIPPHRPFPSHSDPSLSSQLFFKKGRGSGFLIGTAFWGPWGQDTPSSGSLPEQRHFWSQRCCCDTWSEASDAPPSAMITYLIKK